MTRKFVFFCTCIGLIIASFGCDDDVEQLSLECTTAGESRCENNTLQLCNGMIWTTVTTCLNGCNGTECAVLPTAECLVTACKNSTTLTVCSSDFKATDVDCGEGRECIINACQSKKNETNCKDSAHFFADKCEADDLIHCGTHTNDCTKITGWKSGNCISKNCFAEECEAGYHLVSIFDSDNKERTICEQDTHEACGSINTKCNPDEICTQGKCKGSCQPGEVVCDGSCINPNTSTKFCGADTSCSSFIPCSESEDCVDGKCIISSCPNAEDSICTENAQSLCINVHGNNPNHCGACGAVCSDSETAKSSGCDHGKCIYICNEDLINCGSYTEPMCLSADQLKSDPLHCGKCDIKCNDNELCQDGKCIVSSCKSNECFYNNSCINQNDRCGTQCTNCNMANHASAGTCQNGTCKITSCATGYHLTSVGKCALDSATACPNGNATGTVNCNTLQYTKAGNCVNGICQATECQANAHLKDGKCIADSMTKCGTSETNCTQLAGWNTGICENGKCIATTCKSGFCLNALQGQCTDTQSNTTCGIDGGACQSCNPKQVCSTGMCIDKQCEGNVCDQTKVTDETLICKNDNTHCGSECMNCNTFTSNATAGTCKSNGSCQVTACKTNYHTYYNACEEDSLTNCGAHGTKCNIENATNNCSGGKCTFTCNSNYHPYDGACEEDSLTNCGAHGTACGSEYKCVHGYCLHSFYNIISFGHYEQDNDTSNGKEPIIWRVLDYSNGHRLIISDKVLDVQQYNTTKISITWEKCTIRSWLNGYGSSYNTDGIDYESNNFIDTAFTAEEKAKIITSDVPAHANPYHSSIPAGNATSDKIFLMSSVEAQNYFTSGSTRQAYATFYAVNNGVYSYNNKTDKDCTVSNFQQGRCSAFWLLRSPGYFSYDAAIIDYTGLQGWSSVDNSNGVRPAMWIN